MRPLAFKLLTLALTVFLLLTFSLSAFALPIRYWLVTRDVDEQPWPAAARNLYYFAVIKTASGFVLIPIVVKTSNVASTATQEKQSSSSGKNEVFE